MNYDLLPIWVSIITAALTSIWTVYEHFDAKRKERDWQEFESYHKLIKELVEPDKETGFIMLDRQIAVVFELRHFKRYYPVTSRIIKGLLDKHSSHEISEPTKRLIEEMKLTLQAINGD
ncbi:MAG: hypothetical protein NTV43_15860 [Methylococcales bacterium]|nr:hypothetical protein [Methylococcales bacterium]